MRTTITLGQNYESLIMSEHGRGLNVYSPNTPCRYTPDVAIIDVQRQLPSALVVIFMTDPQGRRELRKCCNCAKSIGFGLSTSDASSYRLLNKERRSHLLHRPLSSAAGLLMGCTRNLSSLHDPKRAIKESIGLQTILLEPGGLRISLIIENASRALF